MKKKVLFIAVSIVFIIITIFFTSEVFANNLIEPAQKSDEEILKECPSDRIEIKNTEKEETKIQSKIVLKAGSEEGSYSNPITISAESEFKYIELSDGTISINGFVNKPTKYYKLIIPDTINGKKVSEIGISAFRYNYYLKELILGKNVVTINYDAFANCYSLEKINLKNVKKINDNAFVGDKIGPDLILPDTVEEIYNHSFADTKIQNITLGKNLNTIGNLAFYNSPVKQYNVNSQNSNYSVSDEILYNKDKTELVAYPVEKENTSYTMPQTVKTIKDNAVYGNKYLTTVKISDNVEKIPIWTFGQCTALKNITLGNKTKILGDNAFNSTAIDNFTIPANITSISGTTFLYCENLKNINVNSNNTEYSSINGILFSKDKKTIICYPYGKTDESYSIPNGTVTIGLSAFQASKLNNITIPSSVTTFQDWAFARSSLKEIIIPQSVTKYGYGPFARCKGLTSAYIKSSTDLSYEMFAECISLTTVELNNNIKNFDNRAFVCATSLTQITLPSKLQKINVAAFVQTGIKSITIPSEVTYISANAFNEDTVIDISKTKLTKLDTGAYVVVADVYINGTYDYKKAYECLNILNQERKKIGLSELKMDKDVLEAAMTRAGEISLFFNHSRPNSTSYYVLNKKINSENIAAGSSTAQGAINIWMESTMGHKENMLSKSWNLVGIGCFVTSTGITYWVQNFGNDTINQQSSIPANVTKDVKVQTIEDPLELVWKETGKTDYSVDLNINNVLTPHVSSINKGWSPVKTVLKNYSFEWKSSDTSIATVDSNGKITAKLAGTTTITATIKGLKNKKICMTVNVKLPFEDVSSSAWYYNAVKYVYNNNIIKGYNNTKFGPNDKITRGQFVTVLYRMEGEPSISGKTKFKDVQDTSKFYYKAVKWAEDKKVISGYDNGNFGPEDKITREQLAVILYKYAKYKRKDVSATNNLSEFADTNKISNWAILQVKWAVGAGVITGNNVTPPTLNPKGYATRAEASAMIEKYCKKVGR